MDTSHTYVNSIIAFQVSPKVPTKLSPIEKSAKREIRRASHALACIVKNIVRRKGRTHGQLLHNGRFIGYNRRERLVKSIQVYVQDPFAE